MSFHGSIVVVNFNSGPYLARCIGSILEHAPGTPVVVVDNASADGSERAAEHGNRDVTLVRNTSNVGFGRAVNQVLHLTTGELIMIMNPDACLLPGVIEGLEGELLAHPECAVVGPAITWEDGRLQGSARGDPTLLTGLFGRSSLLTRWFPDSRFVRRNVRVGRALGATPASIEVDWVAGACMVVRRSALVGANGFDERYFMYWEDADLCRRLRKQGHTVRYVPTAVVIHHVGVSSEAARGLALRAFHRSAYTYYATHVARTNVTRALAWVILETRCRAKLLADRFRPRPGVRQPPGQ
jgi:GT2 family glycosyltransferase